MELKSIEDGYVNNLDYQKNIKNIISQTDKSASVNNQE